MFTLGGGDRNRTGVQGFAGPCLSHSATPPEFTTLAARHEQGDNGPGTWPLADPGSLPEPSAVHAFRRHDMSNRAERSSVTETNRRKDRIRAASVLVNSGEPRTITATHRLPDRW